MRERERENKVEGKYYGVGRERGGCRLRVCGEVEIEREGYGDDWGRVWVIMGRDNEGVWER